MVWLGVPSACVCKSSNKSGSFAQEIETHLTDPGSPAQYYSLLSRPGRTVVHQNLSTHLSQAQSKLQPRWAEVNCNPPSTHHQPPTQPTDPRHSSKAT